MKRVASIFGSHPALRLAAAGCVAASLAGCADSERLADPFGNPFHSASRNFDQTPTGSVGSNTDVQSTPLAGPSGGSSAPMAYAPMHSSAPQYAAATPVARANRGGVAGWTAEGGMPIVVAQGETSSVVANRYGIPEAALLRTNGLSSSGQVRPGTRLIIPVYNAALAASSGARLNKHEDVADRDMAARQHAKLAKAEAERAQQTKAAARDSAKDAARESKEKLAKIEVKERHDDRFAKADPMPVQKVETKPVGAPIEKVALTEATPAETKKPADNMPVVQDHPEEKTAEAAPEFRWPARGRIIRGFQGNDGINIALPENTPVKAVEAGVVAYAGNEVKGYGNLILIRHANGFVSAYANNAEIDVKRGESVKRGQIIAKSGQTGNVATPQLHFELRKGSKPVDPIQYLAGL